MLLTLPKNKTDNLRDIKDTGMTGTVWKVHTKPPGRQKTASQGFVTIIKTVVKTIVKQETRKEIFFTYIHVCKARFNWKKLLGPEHGPGLDPDPNGSVHGYGSRKPKTGPRDFVSIRAERFLC